MHTSLWVARALLRAMLPLSVKFHMGMPLGLHERAVRLFRRCDLEGNPDADLENMVFFYMSKILGNLWAQRFLEF